MFGQLNLWPLVEQITNEDTQTIGSHVLIGGEIRVAQLLLDVAEFRISRGRVISFMLVVAIRDKFFPNLLKFEFVDQRGRH